MYFFYNQQFITQSAKADRGSYFVTTLYRTKEEEKEKEKKKRRRKEKRKLFK